MNAFVVPFLCIQTKAYSKFLNGRHVLLSKLLDTLPSLSVALFSGLAARGTAQPSLGQVGGASSGTSEAWIHLLGPFFCMVPRYTVLKVMNLLIYRILG